MPADPTLETLVDFHDEFELADKPHVPRSPVVAYQTEMQRANAERIRNAILGGSEE